MPSVVWIILKVLFWIAVSFIGWLLLMRIIRRFIHTPAPAFIVRLLDSPQRRIMQPPAKVVGWIDIREEMWVLEIGPGPGTFTFEAARRTGEEGKVCAVDIQPAMVSKLNSKLQRKGISNVVARVASAYELPFPDRTFDRVFMVAVLAEIPERKRALLEFRRVLKDDGLLAVGELLPDPDFPRRQTVTRWCRDAGFEPLSEHGNILHYLLTFKKATAGTG